MKWNPILLGELESQGDINLQTGPFGTQLKASDYTEHGTPVINVRNIGFGNLREEKLEYVPENVVERLEKHLLQEGDIVFGRKGAVDRHLLVKEGQSSWMQGSDCIRLRVQSKKITSNFLSYWFLLGSHKNWMLTQCSNKATMASLNQDVIKRIPVSLPDIDVQNKIADILSRYDEAIANNRRRIELLERSSRLLYREWFVHLRYPGHEHGAIDPDGIPEGWEKKQVKQLLGEVKRPKKIKKEEYLKDGVLPCVDQSKSFIGGYTNDSDAAISLEHPVIIFGDHTRVLKFVDFPFASGADGTQLIISKEIEKISQEYFYFSLDAVDLSNYFYARHFKFLKDQWVSVPSRNLMRHFTVIVQSYMLQIKTLRFYNIQLAKARDLLLPRLMNGEINV